jgi:hypothetical protein
MTVVNMMMMVCAREVRPLSLYPHHSPPNFLYFKIVVQGALAESRVYYV